MLVDAEVYKSFLNVVGTTKDKYYNFILNLVDTFVKESINQNLEQQISIVEYYAMQNYDRFTLRQRPVIQIRNLWYDPNGSYGQISTAFDPVTSLQVNGADYVLDIDNPVSVNSVNSTWKSRSGQVLLLNGQGGGRYTRRSRTLNATLGPSLGTIKVEYDAGFPIIPNDLILGVCQMTRALERIIPYGGLTMAMSENTSKYSYSLQQMSNADLSFGKLLSRYKGLGMQV